MWYGRACVSHRSTFVCRKIRADVRYVTHVQYLLTPYTTDSKQPKLKSQMIRELQAVRDSGNDGSKVPIKQNKVTGVRSPSLFLMPTYPGHVLVVVKIPTTTPQSSHLMHSSATLTNQTKHQIFRYTYTSSRLADIIIIRSVSKKITRRKTESPSLVRKNEPIKIARSRTY